VHDAASAAITSRLRRAAWLTVQLAAGFATAIRRRLLLLLLQQQPKGGDRAKRAEEHCQDAQDGETARAPRAARCRRAAAPILALATAAVLRQELNAIKCIAAAALEVVVLRVAICTRRRLPPLAC
jgi:hypothetical protein